MRIKMNNAKVAGIPEAEVAVSPMALDNGMPQVFVGISAVATHVKDAVGSLRLSPAEARDLAARLVAVAEQAESLARTPSVTARGGAKVACKVCGESTPVNPDGNLATHGHVYSGECPGSDKPAGEEAPKTALGEPGKQ